MEHSLHLHVSGVAGRAGDNGMGERILQTGATDVADAILFDVADALPMRLRWRGSRCTGRDCP